LDLGLKKLRDSELADLVGALHHQIDTIKTELIRRKIRHATGAHFRLVLTPRLHRPAPGYHTWCKRMGFVRVVAGDK
jgi:hypothetical protein